MTGQDRRGGSQRVWALVQDHLDRRRDPLGDPAVRAGLEADPELSVAVLDLCETLEWMGPARTGREPFRAAPAARPGLLVPLLLTAALVCLGAWIVVPPGASGVRTERSAEPAPAILEYALTFTRTCGDATHERTLRGIAGVESQELVLVTPGATTRLTERIRR